MFISPSILASDFAHLSREVKAIESAEADMVHIDVMDGMFVPNITLGAPVIKSLRKETRLIFDVHLMISEPIRYISDFAAAGADIITFHAEATDKISETIDEIIRCGALPAIAIKPATAADMLLPYLDRLHMALVMTVEPGFGGQSFMPETMEKVAFLRKAAPKMLIQVDGGIDGKTCKTAAANGANVLVAGSYFFKSEDKSAAVAILKGED